MVAGAGRLSATRTRVYQPINGRQPSVSHEIRSGTLLKNAPIRRYIYATNFQQPGPRQQAASDSPDGHKRMQTKCGKYSPNVKSACHPNDCLQPGSCPCRPAYTVRPQPAEAEYCDTSCTTLAGRLYEKVSSAKLTPELELARVQRVAAERCLPCGLRNVAACRFGDKRLDARLACTLSPNNTGTF